MIATQPTLPKVGRIQASCILVLLLLSGCVSAPVGQASERDAPSFEKSVPSSTAAHRSPFKEPPGILLNDVTQANIKTTICVAGWTATVRPSTSFTQGLKKLMLSRAGLNPGDAPKYELDHFVPLAIGGHPRSEDNLWLQRWDGAWNARVKDHLEKRLQVLVCSGEITLHTARAAVRNDWHAAYRKYVAAESAAVPRGIDVTEAEVVE